MSILRNMSVNKLPDEYATELIWMARRYADGRGTYVTTTINKIIDKALWAGLAIQSDLSLKDPEGMYASDMHFGFWRNGRFVKDKSSGSV